MNKTVIVYGTEKRKLFIWAIFVPVRLSEHPEDLPLAIEEMPRVAYLLKIDELRSSEL